MKKIYFIAAVFALALAGCGEQDEQASMLTFEMELTNGGEKVSINDTVHLEEEYDFYMSLFRLYLSKITLTTTSGDLIPVENVVLLSPANDGQNSFSASVPTEAYNKLSVGFGVDPVQNNLKPENFQNEHPLSSYQSMYWTMLKYRFAKFEGKAFSRLDDVNDNIMVAYHPGTDELYHSRSFDIDLSESPDYHLKLSLDINEIMNGPAGKIDFATEATTHSTPEDIHIAEKFMKNIAASADVSTGGNSGS